MSRHGNDAAVPLRILTEEAAEADFPPSRIAQIAERAKPYRHIRFIDDVLKRYRRAGTMSAKQAAVLLRIVNEEEGA
jgi:hypothetical protein